MYLRVPEVAPFFLTGPGNRCVIGISFSTGLFSGAILVFKGSVVLKSLFVTNLLPPKKIVPEKLVMDDIFPYPSVPLKIR